MTFQEYVTNLQTDFKTDGVLNSDVLVKSLASSAVDLDIDQVVLNLKNRYDEVGISFTPYNNIKPLLKKFNNNSNPSIDNNIFPVTVKNAINLISNQDTIIINKNAQYAIAINCPPNNAFDSIVVVITSNSSGYTISNANLYAVGNTKRFGKIMTDNTNVSIPISFIDSGQLVLETYSSIKGVSTIKKSRSHYIIWR